MSRNETEVEGQELTDEELSQLLEGVGQAPLMPEEDEEVAVFADFQVLITHSTDGDLQWKVGVHEDSESVPSHYVAYCLSTLVTHLLSAPSMELTGDEDE